MDKDPKEAWQSRLVPIPPAPTVQSLQEEIDALPNPFKVNSPRNRALPKSPLSQDDLIREQNQQEKLKKIGKVSEISRVMKRLISQARKRVHDKRALYSKPTILNRGEASEESNDGRVEYVSD